MPYNLNSRAVLVVAGSRGLGAVIALRFAAEGANVAINYVTSKDRAEGVAREAEQKYGVKIALVQGDAGVLADCERIVREARDALGGLDVVIQNAGWTRPTPLGDLHAMSEDEWDLAWAVNVKGQMAVLRAARPILEQNPDGGAFIATGSVAGTSLNGSSLPYCVTKAAQIHFIKCAASTQGQKVRINIVLPGLLITEWIFVSGADPCQSDRFSEEAKRAVIERSTLKQPTDLEDCADAFVMIAKNTSMTGQMVTVDAGYNILGR